MKKFILIITLFFVSISFINAQTITTVTPNSAYQGDVLTITITGVGTHFQSASSNNVWINQGIGTIPLTAINPTTELTIEANLSIPLAQTIGYYSVNINNSIDGNLVLINGFEILFLTGINYTSEDINLNIYPNPSSDYIFINSRLSENNDVYINIFSLNGKIVRKIELKNVSTLNEKINIKELPAGIYSMIIKIGNTFYTKKIVKE